MLSKKCLTCGKEFFKPPTTSLKDWEGRVKYCSRSCSPTVFKRNVYQGHGFKKNHAAWNKGRRTGIVPKTAFKFGREGSQCWNWKGDKVGYVSLHRWVSYHKGKPEVCEHCKMVNKKKYEWANISKKYTRNLNDWIRLCTSCHRKFDNIGT